MNAFAHHFAFEFKTGIRNKQLLMLNYLFPLGFFFLMGSIMTQVNPLFEQQMIPAMVVFAVLASTLLGMPDPLVTAREKGIFRSYRINGVPSLSILLIPALTTMLHAVIVAGIIIAASSLLFGAPLPVHWEMFALVFAALLVACTGLSVLIGVISPSSRMTVLWSQLIFTPSMLLGGMMMPLEFLPDAAVRIAHLLPATHAMTAFNKLAMGSLVHFAPWYSVAALFGMGLAGFGLAVVLFSWDSKNAARRMHVALAALVLLPVVLGIATASFELPELRQMQRPGNYYSHISGNEHTQSAQVLHETQPDR